ncbi:molybdopterin molybdotransferase MoeA [Streptomyces sp. NBC_00237]|uniref:molybdopterin molybdotransferase MoeA n=1 Tax=Streptomyces sp. NBC_00237 TaxID=2975687 RepID=UPI0022555BE8|nr:molybdopterin molybdotransferase MoeA [Streptomyces sp. NBC_00237]MCX5200130.1 molybdopterin molybdotransferase MoeA [Streptomyces sp. NBC_00237]
MNDTEHEIDGIDQALALVSRTQPAAPAVPAPAAEAPAETALPTDPADSGAPAAGPANSDTAPAHPTSTPWPEARAAAALAGRTAPARPRRVPLEQALAQILAEPLEALTDLPSFDTSAMDGWAVAGPGPWSFQDGAGILAGRAAPDPLGDGEAVRIATGARIPAEATAVIRSEHAHADEGKQRLHAQREVIPGQDIRPRGQECRTGDRLLPSGSVVTPAVLGLAAAAGYDTLLTVPRPTVEVLVLGDELLTSGLPRDGMVRDALGPLLAPWLRALGAEVLDTRCLGDDPEALRRAVLGSEADVVVTTGGTAAGPVDHVHPILAAIGAELLVDGVDVRPGHPMLLARIAPDTHLVGLPGNPLAAVSGLLTLAEPLLRALAHRPAPEPYRAPVRDDVPGHPVSTRLVPVTHRADSTGAEHAVPLHYNGPAMLRGIAAADGLAVVPPGGARAGDELEILDLPWAEGCFT